VKQEATKLWTQAHSFAQDVLWQCRVGQPVITLWCGPAARESSPFLHHDHDTYNDLGCQWRDRHAPVFTVCTCKPPIKR
jgi:hypothetical protein